MGENKTQIIVIEDREWELRKVPALAGSNLLRRYLGSNAFEPKDFLSTLTDEQYESVQRTCLCAVSSVTAGPQGPAKIPVMMVDGRWGIEELSSHLTYALVVASVWFQVQDFFGENALKGFDKAIGSLTPSNA